MIMEYPDYEYQSLAAPYLLRERTELVDPTRQHLTLTLDVYLDNLHQAKQLEREKWRLERFNKLINCEISHF